MGICHSLAFSLSADILPLSHMATYFDDIHSKRLPFLCIDLSHADIRDYMGVEKIKKQSLNR